MTGGAMVTATLIWAKEVAGIARISNASRNLIERIFSPFNEGLFDCRRGRNARAKPARAQCTNCLKQNSCEWMADDQLENLCPLRLPVRRQAGRDLI